MRTAHVGSVSDHRAENGTAKCPESLCLMLALPLSGKRVPPPARTLLPGRSSYRLIRRSHSLSSANHPPRQLVVWGLTPHEIHSLVGCSSAMAILQQPYFRNYTVRRILPRKWRLVLFAMAFSLCTVPS